jgi:formate-dependent nitrite reductase membrane component NrfD
MNYVNGIPLWNTALLPILYLISGLWGGAEVTLGIVLTGGDGGIGQGIEEWIRILLIGFILLIPVYLVSVRYTSSTGLVSVKSMVLGKWALLFWIGVVVIGMVIPLTAVISSFLVGLESTPVSLLYIAIACGLLGDLAMRYLILRCGFYTPLVLFSSHLPMPVSG